VNDKTSVTQGADQVVAALNQLAAFGTQQMLTAIQNSQPLVDAYLSMLRNVAVLPMTAMPAVGSAMSSIGQAIPSAAAAASSMMPAIPSLSSMMPKTTCCEIPETDCPPRCVCQIVWCAARGEHVTATIALTNTAKKTQTFNIAATSFKGPDGDTGVTATVTPASVNLNPNQSATIAVALEVNDKFDVGTTYGSEVTLTGQYEQCVELRVCVRPTQLHHCEVRQGDIPTHIRAHRWYHHFQCEEPCFEPASPRTPQTPGTPNHAGMAGHG
jgi:hypothetical protein